MKNVLIDDFIEMLKQNAVEFGGELKGDLEVVRVYTSSRLTVLQAAIKEPGFREALTAERDSLALKIAGRAIDRADAFDARITGIAEAFLGTAAKALALM